MSFTYKYPRPAVTVDIVLFRLVENKWHVLLIERKSDPYAGHWAFPGGFVDMDEDLEQAAHRELKEETSLCDITLTQFHTFGKVDRDPRGRTISVGYTAILPDGIDMQPLAGDDAAKAEWFFMANLPNLAFDHNEVLNSALLFHKQQKNLDIW